MSDDFFPSLPPLVSAVKARNLARAHKAMADLQREVGDVAAATRSERDSAWWMAYAIALSQIPPGRIDDGDLP